MDCLTVERLKKSLDYDPETGVFTRLSTTNFNPKVVAHQRAGSLAPAGYRYVRIGKQRYAEHRLAWFYMKGVWPQEDVDHVNGVKDDNRFANLREATRSQNMANTKVQKNSTTGVKGVHFDKVNQRWVAHMRVDKRMKNLGRFDTVEEAIAVRAAAFEKVYGQFAHHGGAVS